MARDPSERSRRESDLKRQSGDPVNTRPSDSRSPAPSSRTGESSLAPKRTRSYGTDDAPWRNTGTKSGQTARIPAARKTKATGTSSSKPSGGPKGTGGPKGVGGDSSGTGRSRKNPPIWKTWLDRIPNAVKWSVLGLVGVIVLTMILDASIFYNKVHAGVSVAGQSVSGMTRDEAIQELQQFVDEAQSAELILTGDDETWQIMPDDLGTQIDVEGAVDDALAVTRQSNFVVDMAKKLKLYFSGEDVPLGGSVDFTMLDEFIQQVAMELDEPAVNAGVAIRGSMVATVREKEGWIVDQDALRQLLTDAVLGLQSGEITVPMMVDEPDIVVEDNATAMAQARTMISAPVTLTWGAQSWTFSPQELAAFIEFTVPEEGAGEDSSATPVLSADKMTAKLQQVGAETAVAEPTDASFKVVDGKAVVVPAVEGVQMDAVKTAAALTEAALKTTERIAEVQGEKQEPEFTTAEAEAMGITDLLATYSDRYVGSANRQTNVRLTAQYIFQDGRQLIAPGEEFNFLEEVGPRTPERGYVKAPGISAGMQLEDQYGGGICEISTAVFNAAFRAGLEITERRNHTIYFDHYPKGMDATVSDDGPNLRFVNNTGHYIWITGESDGKSTTIEIYGTDDGREVSWSVSKWYGVWGPYTSTTLDPSLPTGVSILIYEGEKAKMCMLYRDIVWPDGRKVRDNLESNYKHQFKIVKVGTGTTTTVYNPPAATTTLP